MTIETFRPNPARPHGDTLGLKIGDAVTHPLVSSCPMTITGFAAGWDASCPATVIMDTGDDEVGNIAPGKFSCGARWLTKVKGGAA